MFRTTWVVLFGLCTVLLQGGCGGDAGCKEHVDCDSSSICVDTECRPAFGHKYTFTFHSVEVSQLNRDDQAWDESDGLPDVMVCAYVNNPDVPYYCTPAIEDSYTPTFNTSFEIAIDESDIWVFAVYDEDPPDFDWVDGTPAEKIDLQTIQSGGFVADGDYMTNMDVAITPVP